MPKTRFRFFSATYYRNPLTFYVMAHKLIRTMVAAILAVTAISSSAEIEKFAIPNDKGMAFYWWPKLSSVAGWKQDPDVSFQYSINALAPEGKAFGDAETVMYAKAIFKPRMPEAKSLDDLVEIDRKNFLADAPGATFRAAPSITTADGHKLISLIYMPKETGNWERVSYLEEGNFYIIFVISSRTLAGFNASSKAYEDLVTHYKVDP